MRWWCFDGNSLDRALLAYTARKTSEQPGRKTDFQQLEILMRDFLHSTEALEHKLRGDMEP